MFPDLTELWVGVDPLIDKSPLASLTNLKTLNDNPFVREAFILKRGDINNVGDVLDTSRTELLLLRNFGEKSYEELFVRMRNRMEEFAAQREHADEDLGE